MKNRCLRPTSIQSGLSLLVLCTIVVANPKPMPTPCECAGGLQYEALMRSPYDWSIEFVEDECGVRCAEGESPCSTASYTFTTFMDSLPDSATVKLFIDSNGIALLNSDQLSVPISLDQWCRLDVNSPCETGSSFYMFNMEGSSPSHSFMSVPLERFYSLDECRCFHGTGGRPRCVVETINRSPSIGSAGPDTAIEYVVKGVLYGNDTTVTVAGAVIRPLMSGSTWCYSLTADSAVTAEDGSFTISRAPAFLNGRYYVRKDTEISLAYGGTKYGEAADFFDDDTLNVAVFLSGYEETSILPQEHAASASMKAGWSVFPLAGGSTVRFVIRSNTVPGNFQIDILSPSGRALRRLSGQLSNGETRTITWNGRDSRGSRAARGAYVAVVSLGGEKKMVQFTR